MLKNQSITCRLFGEGKITQGIGDNGIDKDRIGRLHDDSCSLDGLLRFIHNSSFHFLCHQRQTGTSHQTYDHSYLFCVLCHFVIIFVSDAKERPFIWQIGYRVVMVLLFNCYRYVDC